MTNAPRLFPATPARLGTWLDCPRMYRFRYIDRPPPPKEPPSAEQSWGNTIHNALRAWFDLPRHQRNPEALARLAYDQWVDAGWRDQAQQARWRLLAANVLLAYGERTVGAGIPEPVGVERTVGATYRDMALSGRVDRIDEDADGLVIIDYKATRKPPTQDDVRGSLALAVYAYAAWRTLRRRCLRIELHHVPTGTVVAHEHTEETLRRHLDRANDIAVEARDATEFPPNPGPLCGWCSYLRSCPEGLQQVGGVLREPWESIDNREQMT